MGSAQTQRKRQPGELLHELRRHFKAKDCLHPDAGSASCETVIAAHTIQRAGPIARLTDSSNHVRSFLPLRRTSSGEPIVNSIGWRDASTFPGFCAYHDRHTFAPLEQEAFSASLEQCFLAGYRALCHEFYKKRAAVSYAKEMREWIQSAPETFSPWAEEYFEWHEAGELAGLRDSRHYKARADNALVRRDYSEWSTRVLWFEGDFGVASAGCFHPDYDLSGAQLQNLYDLDATAEPLIISSIATDRGGAILFSHPRGAVAPERFVRSLEERPPGRIASTVVQVFFGYIENTFFSEEWWSRLRPMQQRHVRMLAGTTRSYGSPVPLIASDLVGWRGCEFSRERAA